MKVSERGRLSKGAGQRRGLGKGGGWAKEGAEEPDGAVSLSERPFWVFLP